jgi:hypothetical protein
MVQVVLQNEELNMMMESFRACLAAMFWSLVLLIFMVFVRHWAVCHPCGFPSVL